MVIRSKKKIEDVERIFCMNTRENVQYLKFPKLENCFSKKAIDSHAIE